ncbi:SH3 domain-containing protein [Corallococcus exiguus]|uniref:hypothetical protein n=2 Tax=Corallococcus exiguus TaxID=83462 RepID=UPI001C995A3A|nr:hypothetical protein [Corallococcus exiguus]
MPFEAQQPTTYPWPGKVIPWSAALRHGPAKSTRTLADLPHGENVQIVSSSGDWLYVECRHESRMPLKGYVSRELIKHAQPTHSSPAGSQNAKTVVTPQHFGSPVRQDYSSAHDPSVAFQLTQPKIIAIATDTYLKPTHFIADPKLPGKHVLGFGQDLSFATGRAQPHGPSVGTTPAALDGKMRRLLKEFAGNDTRGKARRLFDAFLKPQRALLFWSDSGLTADAEAHPNITTFVHRALSAPNSPERTAGQVRIHQALEKVGWNINAVTPIKGLGVPAFNEGSPAWHTGDFSNGLGVMINGIQHVVVIAKEYRFDRPKSEYTIKLEYVFYDVFGLDDDDLQEYGADGGFDSDASQGITAWWQLQFQHGYVPLITRIAFEREFTVPVPAAGAVRR